MENTEEKHNKYTVSVRIKPNLSNQPGCLQPFQSKFIKEMRPKSIVTYCFDSVFEENHDNAHIYAQSLKKTVDFYLQRRINTTILAYGQTGSGKTYTLFGHKDKGQKGLVDYIIDDILEFTIEKNLTARCSFLQIYKEKVSDLMTGQGVQLRENGEGQLFLEGLKVFQTASKEELLELLRKAHSNKIFGQSYINSESSRSHVIFSLQIKKRKFNVVDLCGSEVLTFKFDQQQRDQTNSINLSLFTLNAVVNDLAFSSKKSKKHIPFRNSVLTRILRDSLLDLQKSQIYLFCNVSPQQKHQTFSASTLRFGQLAIQIDETNNVVEEKINLSQEKREKKMVSNIVEISPDINKGQGTYKIDWVSRMARILAKKTRLYELKQEGAQYDILVLHAYGYGCCGEDWNLHLSYLTKRIKVNLYSVDFPGFGDSEGKKFTSRAQKFHEKEQPLEFMLALFQLLGFSPKRKVILMGYDLGGAIALGCGLHAKLSKAIDGLVVFHPTWTDSIEKVNSISAPTLILWVPVETFHLITAGTKMAKMIKNAKMFKLNIGPYTNEKAGGYYDSYGETMMNIVAEFVKDNKKIQCQTDDQAEGRRQRGKVVEESIEVRVNQQEQLLKNSQEAVREVMRLKEEGELKQAYESLARGGPNRPKFVRLAAQLPDFKLSTFSWELCQKYFLFSEAPKNLLNFTQLPFFSPGQQVHVLAKINLNALHPEKKYLAYDPQGEIGITHLAYLSQVQNEQEIVEKEQIRVKVQAVSGSLVELSVPLSEVLFLNSPTVYKKNHQGALIFEDSVFCSYNSNFVKLKLVECCYLLQPTVSQMDFGINNHSLLEQQKKCTRIIFEQLDLRHLVHEGIDNTRFTGVDAGRLAYFGQGNCHHLASVTAAFLLPFGKVLGWEVLFRAGSFFKTGRELDQNGQPLKEWNGRPKVNVEDHTWLQIRYKPSNRLFVFDPSFGICSVPLEEVYSLQGKMHISGKPLNFALEYEVPSKLWVQ